MRNFLIKILIEENHENGSPMPELLLLFFFFGENLLHAQFAIELIQNSATLFYKYIACTLTLLSILTFIL